MSEIDELFIPGQMPVVPRRANRFKKGYLKKRQFLNRICIGEQKQGSKEKARRLRQIERGIIRP